MNGAFDDGPNCASLEALSVEEVTLLKKAYEDEQNKVIDDMTEDIVGGNVQSPYTFIDDNTEIMFRVVLDSV